MQKKIKAQRRLHNGIPTVFVNGKPFHLGSVGVNCYYDRSMAFLKTDPETVCLLWPTEMCTVSDSPDLEAIQRRFEDVLRKYPNALLSCVLEIGPAPDWVRQHLEEMTAYDYPLDWKDIKVGRRPEPSWASRRWQQDCAQFFGKVVRHLHTVFNGRIILYQIGSGKCGENAPLTDPVRYGSWSCGDFSEPMLLWFRQRLKKYYSNDLSKLRYAWSDSKVTFDSALPPDRVERMQTEWFSFRSPQRSQTADYYRAWSEAIEENVLVWAKAIKDATNNESLTASPIASVLDCGINASTLQHLMKNTFEKCLKSPYLDMLQSPASYILRNPGNGDTSAMVPLGTVTLGGKIWFRDFDSRTSVVGNSPTSNHLSSLWRNPDNTWEDAQLFKRDASYSIMKGGAWFWHEIIDGMFKLPEHIKIAKRIAVVGRGVLNANRAMVPGLGVFTNNDSNFRLADSNRLIFAMNYEPRRIHWTHAGMACEVYCLDDACHPDMPAHKLMMVTNAFCMSDKQVAGIKKMAAKNKATVIWLMAPGLITPKGFDLDRVSKITGFKIRSADVEAQPTVMLTADKHRWCKVKMSDGRPLEHFGVGPNFFDDSGSRAVGPLFYADNDADAEVLGVLDVLNQPGLLVKQIDGYTSVFCSAPYIHHALLNVIGRDSGVHLYTQPGDLVHAAANLLLINANSTGTKKINFLKKEQIVFDLYTGRTICRKSRSFSLKMRKYETRFLFAGSEKTAQKVKTAMSRSGKRF